LLVSGLWSLASGHLSLATGIRYPAPGSSGYWFLVAGLWLLVSGFWSLVAGLWLLVSGFWSLVAGLWLLAGRCRVPDAGYRIPDTGCRIPGFRFSLPVSDGWLLAFSNSPRAMRCACR